MAPENGRILGIETSCDETSVAVVEGGRVVLSCVISSSKKDFATIGGVIPEQAAREQLRCMLPVIDAALEKSGCTHTELSAIAVTAGPGLLGSLLVGTTTARVLGAVWGMPVIPVHHTLGHLHSAHIHDPADPPGPPPVYPILTLSVSGGHTDLWLRTGPTEQRLLGSTIDDAAGEAFDKGAVQLGLPYPGGPALEALARDGNDSAHVFPISLRHQATLDCSFSGLKTSLRYLLRDRGGLDALSHAERADIAASYQRAIVLQLIDRVERALDQETHVREIHVVGGVSANGALRTATSALATSRGLTLRTPRSLRYCTDNGAMIAAAGWALLQAGVSEQPFTTRASMALC